MVIFNEIQGKGFDCESCYTYNRFCNSKFVNVLLMDTRANVICKTQRMHLENVGMNGSGGCVQVSQVSALAGHSTAPCGRYKAK
jgi:hypothetical protein